jgi:hypothetical protein
VSDSIARLEALQARLEALQRELRGLIPSVIGETAIPVKTLDEVSIREDLESSIRISASELDEAVCHVVRCIDEHESKGK